jgi:hypothetical protein
MTARRISVSRLTALQAVEAGRVQYGAVYPRMARRHPERALHGILLDDHELYGGQYGTYRALIEAELIRERLEDIEMVTAPAREHVSTSVSGERTVTQLPEHPTPADPGYRVLVELTPTGRAALDQALAAAGGQS